MYKNNNLHKNEQLIVEDKTKSLKVLEVKLYDRTHPVYKVTLDFIDPDHHFEGGIH